MKNLRKGFTLTELLIVIVIIGILAAVLIPSLSTYVNKAKKSAAEQDALGMYKEYISTINYTDDDSITNAEKDFYIIEDKFYVVIVDGGINGSYSASEFAAKYTDTASDNGTIYLLSYASETFVVGAAKYRVE